MAAQHKPRNPEDVEEEIRDVPRYQGPTPMQPATTITPRMAAAHHEGAHVVAAICAGGCTVDAVEVDDRGGGIIRGHRGTAGDSTEQRLQWLAREMKIVFAGQEGSKWINPHGMFRACETDRSYIEKLRLTAEILTGDRAQAEELLEDSRREAGALIDEFWPFVQKIAKALNKRGRLSGDEIWEILGGRPKVRNANEEPAKQRAPQKTPASPILAARVEGGFNLPPDRRPDPGQCEAATRAFQRRHSGRDYAF